MVDINITFGMHGIHSGGLPYTYQVYLSDGVWSIAQIFDHDCFGEQMQDFIKQGLRKFTEIRK